MLTFRYWSEVSYKLLFHILILLIPVTLKAETPADVAWDSQLTVRTLDNGFRYIAYNSETDSDPFNLRLIVHVGSVDDELRGMAHNIEHMVFRANKAYAGNTIYNYLDLLGWRTGLQVNALTRQSETQFMVRTRPDDALNLEQSIDLLANIAFNASLLDEDWQVERNVILEEMRLGDSLAGRVNELKKKVVRNNSRYADRPTIGLKEDVQNTTIEDIRAFYETFYVPANMTLIVTGNIDLKVLDSAVNETFGKQPFSPAPVRDYVELPLKEQLYIGKVQDPQGVSSIVSTGFRSPLEPYTTMEGLYQRFQIYFLRRLASRQVRQQMSFYENVDINSLSLVFEESTAQRQVLALAARTPDHDLGLKAVLTEIERLKQNGLNREAFEQLKADARQSVERNRTLVTQRNFQQWEDKITTAVMQQGILEDYEVRASRTLQWIDDLTLSELNERLNELLSADDQFIYYQVPGGIERDLPSQQQVKAFKARLPAKKLPLAQAPEPSQEADNALTEKEQEPVRIDWSSLPAASEPPPFTKKSWPETGVQQWTLDNGYSVVWLKQPTRDNKLYIRTIDNGGYLNSQNPEWMNKAAVQVWQQTDLSPVSAEHLQGWQGQNGIEWSWTHREHQLDRGAVIEADKLDKLIRLYTARQSLWQFSESDFEQLMDTLSTSIQAMSEPQEALNTLETLDHSAFKDIMRTFAQQPATLYIVGEATKAQIAGQVLPYLATLTTSKPFTMAAATPAPEGSERRVDYIHPQGKATVTINGHSTLSWKPETSFYISALNPIIQRALRNELRHRLGGVYRVQFEMQLNQNDQLTTRLEFTTNPGRVDELIAASEGVLNNLENVIASENLDRVRDDIDFAESLRMADANTWLRRLILSFKRYQSPQYLHTMQQLSQSIDAEQLTSMAEQIFPLKSQRIFIGLPVNKK
ncbi:M16 family metallopeptidase [Endozoicomonas lisbonensis]